VRIVGLCLIGVLLIGGGATYLLRYQIGLAVHPAGTGPTLTPRFQAYIDLMSDLTPEQRRSIAFIEQDETIVAVDYDGRSEEISAALVEHLDGLDCRLALEDITYVFFLQSLNCASLELAVPTTALVDDVSAIDLANLTKLRTEELAPLDWIDREGQTWPEVTSLAYGNPYDQGLRVVSYFPNLTDLTVMLPDENADKGDFSRWYPQPLLDSQVTSLTLGTSSDLWYSSAWQPELLTRPAASLADWLTTHPGNLQTINGVSVANFDHQALSNLTADELAQYRADKISSMARAGTAILGATDQYNANLPALTGGLAVDFATGVAGRDWQASFSNGPAGKDFRGVAASYLPVIPDELRYVIMVNLRNGANDGWYYSRSTGERTGQAFLGITYVVVYDLVDYVSYGFFDTASTSAPDEVQGSGDHSGPIQPQTAIDWVVSHLS
jgi:hypothetical protein